MNLLRLVRVLLALPGRAVIWLVDRPNGAHGLGSLGPFTRGCVHGFVWICALMAFAIAIAPPATTTRGAAGSSRSAAPLYTPMPRPTGSFDSAPTRTSVEAAVGGQLVARVIDGDTFALADGRKVRVLGIDSCESDTPGGTEATTKARELLVGAVELRAEAGADKDQHGRLLRYVQTSSGDFGELMVGYDHTGVYQGGNDASDAYLATLYAHDLDHAASPPSGRECGFYPSPAPSTAGNEPDYVPVSGDDDDGESRFCRKRWWC